MWKRFSKYVRRKQPERQSEKKPSVEFPSTGGPTVILLCNNSRFLEGTKAALLDLIQQAGFPIKVVSELLTANANYVFTKDNWIFLVATPIADQIKLNKADCSIHSKIYFEANKVEAAVFFALVGHSESKSLADGEGYASRSNKLRNSLRKEKELQNLIKMGRFISLPFTNEPERIQFNSNQTCLIISWLEKMLIEYGISGNLEQAKSTNMDVDFYKAHDSTHLNATKYGFAIETIAMETTTGNVSSTVKVQSLSETPKHSNQHSMETDYHQGNQSFIKSIGPPPFSFSNAELSFNVQNMPKPMIHISPHETTGEREKQCKTLRLLVACRNSRFLDFITAHVKSILEYSGSNVNVASFDLTTNIKPTKVLRDINLLVLVGMSNQRLMLLSDKEPGPLNALYHEAKTKEVSTFFILAGHFLSCDLKPAYPYPNGIESLFKSQPILGGLRNKHQFISLGFVHNPQNLVFNAKQREMFNMWIQEGIMYESSRPSVLKHKLSDDEDDDTGDYSSPVKKTKLHHLQNAFKTLSFK